MAEHDLSPKRALITGAGKRIGRALAEALGEDGWSVAVHYRSSAKGAEETAEAISKAGGMGVIVQGDLTEAEKCIVIDYLETDLDGFPWPLDPDANDYETRIRDMVGFMLSLPRWQFQ